VKLVTRLLFLSLFSISYSLHAEADKPVWISLGSDAFELFSSSTNDKINMQAYSSSSVSKSSNNDIMIVSIPESQLDALSGLMHENFHRCGGYFYHNSLQEALHFNNKSGKLKTARAVNYTIDNSDTVASLLSQLSLSNLESTITNLSNYNNRYYQSQTGVDSTALILDSWQGIAAGRADISVEYFNHPSWIQPSVIATIEGTALADEYVIVGGHLDSINSGSPVNGQAPGADDNASGIAVITELLNMIVGSDFRPARSLLLMGYAAEEVGLRGSQEIASSYSAENKNVVGVAQFDMTSFNGTRGKDVIFITDYTDDQQNRFMEALIDTYLPEISYGHDICGYACSDHASWTNRGYPASFPFESTFNDSNRTIHTTNDTDFDVDHVMKFTQLAATYVAELAKGEIGSNQPAGALEFAVLTTEVNGGDDISLTVNRSGGTSSAVSIDYTTANDTAIAGTDYTADSGTLNWDNQDNTAKTITVTTNNVTQDKSFYVLLSNPQGGGILSSQSSIEVTIKSTSPPNNAPDPVGNSGGGTLHPAILLLLLLFAVKRNKGVSATDRLFRH